MYIKSITDFLKCILAAFSLITYLACSKDCPDLYSCDEKIKLFYGEWTSLRYFDNYYNDQNIHSASTIDKMTFIDKVGRKKYSTNPDSMCFIWFISCSQDSIIIREDNNCSGRTSVFATEDVYFIEKYSPLEIKLVKYRETRDSGKLIKHYDRYILLK